MCMRRLLLSSLLLLGAAGVARAEEDEGPSRTASARSAAMSPGRSPAESHFYQKLGEAL